MKKNRRKLIILALIVILLLVGYIVYTRPMSLAQLYPNTDFSHLSLMEGYRLVPDSPGSAPFNQEEFRAEPGSETYESLLKLLTEQEYRRSVLSPLRKGRRSYSSQAGDKLWCVTLFFDREDLPNGSFTGSMLHIGTTFGKLDMSPSSPQEKFCTFFMKDQKTWNEAIYDLIGS